MKRTRIAATKFSRFGIIIFAITVSPAWCAPPLSTDDASALVSRHSLVICKFVAWVGIFFWITTTMFDAHAGNCQPFSSIAKINVPLPVAELRLVDCNRDVLAAQRAYEAVVADRVTAGQRPNPNLTIGASNINPRVGIGSGSIQDKTIDSTVRFDQLIERGDKASLREQQADAAIRAAKADWQDVIRQQRLQLRQNYFELLYQQARIVTQQEFATIARDGLNAAEIRLKSGDIAVNETNRFRLDHARAQNDLRQAEVDARKAKLEFAKSIGAETVALDLVAERIDLPKDNLKAIAQLANADQRADLVAAANRIEAALAAKALAASIAARDVTVSAQFEHWPTSAINQQGTGNSFGLSFSIPLSVRHANEGEVKRASVDLEAARDLLNRLRIQARTEADASIDAWRAATERAARTERDLLPLAREVARAAEFAYRNGATSVLDLLDARRTLKQSELDAAQASTDAGKAWAQWFASTELMAEPLAESNRTAK